MAACLLGAASIGLPYVPAAVALLALGCADPSARSRPPSADRPAGDGSGLGGLRALDDDVVDHAVLQRLLGGEPAVPLGVGRDLLDRLTGVEGDQLGHAPLRVRELLGLDGDVGRLARRPADGWCIMIRALGSV